MIRAAALALLAALAGCSMPADPSFPTLDVPSPSTAAATPCPIAPAAVCAVVVARIVDGDTLRVRMVDGHAETVRLIGIDTPEVAHRGTPADCYGPEAAVATAELAGPGTRLQLVLGAEPRDRYRRLLADAALPGGRLLNAELVWSGYARTLRIAPNTAHAAGLARLQREAKAARRGLWHACPVATTTTKGP